MVDESVPASVPHQGAPLDEADSELQTEPALDGQTSESSACPHAHLGRAHEDNLLTFALLLHVLTGGQLVLYQHVFDEWKAGARRAVALLRACHALAPGHGAGCLCRAVRPTSGEVARWAAAVRPITGISKPHRLSEEQLALLEQPLDWDFATMQKASQPAVTKRLADREPK